MFSAIAEPWNPAAAIRSNGSRPSGLTWSKKCRATMSSACRPADTVRYGSAVRLPQPFFLRSMLVSRSTSDSRSLGADSLVVVGAGVLDVTVGVGLTVGVGVGVADGVTSAGGPAGWSLPGRGSGEKTGIDVAPRPGCRLAAVLGGRTTSPPPRLGADVRVVLTSIAVARASREMPEAVVAV